MTEFFVYDLIDPRDGGGAPSRVSRPKRQKLTKKWAEIMARALQLMHGGKRLMLGPYDVTAIFHGLVSRFIEDHGEEKVCAALLPFGVKLEVKYGQAASL